jgi:4-hydroxy-tetrahydrodipicolinate synthase
VSARAGSNSGRAPGDAGVTKNQSELIIMRQSKMARPLRGIVPPLVTPLVDRDALDVGGMERLVEHVLGGGVHGLFVLGTTGEAPSLGHAVQYDVVSRVTRQVAGRVPVLVGVTDASFAESVRLAGHAADAGADAVVLAPPHYFPLEQADLVEYVEAICRQLPLPLFLYNMPSHTKVHFAPETLRQLVRLDGVVGFKDSSARAGCFNQIRGWVARERPDLSLLIGPEEMVAECVPLGAHGGVSGGANVFPRLFVDLYDAAVRGDAAAVAALQANVLRLAETVYAVGKRSGGAVVRLKAALSCLGVCGARVAEPLHPLAANEVDLVRRNLAALDLGPAGRRSAAAGAVDGG